MKELALKAMGIYGVEYYVVKKFVMTKSNNTIALSERLSIK